MTGIRLQPGDLETIAKDFNVPEAGLRAVIETETSGHGFTSAGQVEFLFEPHQMYKNVPKEKLQEAISKGVAYKFWKGPGNYPKTPALRWQQFQLACTIDETAAIKSASWGLGQIMGSEFAEAGYDSPQHMLVAFQKSEYEQVLGLAHLIKHRGLDADLRNFPDIDACRHFALRFNGAQYAKNNYHNKLHDSFVRWAARKVPPPEQVTDGSLHMGDRDKEKEGGPVWNAQQLLRSKGYSIKADGIFGNGTKITVLAWQANTERATTGFLSKEELQELPNSPMMPVQAERANTTVEDLKPTSTIIQKTSFGKKVLGWIGGGLATGQAIDATGILDTGQAVVDKATQAKGIVVSARELVVDSGASQLIHVILDYKFPILCIVVVIGFFLLNQIQKKRLEMHKTGEIA